MFNEIAMEMLTKAKGKDIKVANTIKLDYIDENRLTKS